MRKLIGLVLSAGLVVATAATSGCGDEGGGSTVLDSGTRPTPGSPGTPGDPGTPGTDAAPDVQVALDFSDFVKELIANDTRDNALPRQLSAAPTADRESQGDYPPSFF